jgi:xanthine dehydrogenase accessory factor
MDRRLTREALRLMELHQPFVRATVVRTTGSVPGKLGASMILRSDGSFLGTVGGAALEEQVKALAARAFEDRQGNLHHFDLQAWKPGGLPSLCGGAVDIAVEYVPARPNVLLWGGGHVAHALATLLPTLEYDYSVADDRPDWVGADRFPTADRREVVAPEELWTRFEPAAFTHLYLLGYDAKKDLEVLHSAVSVFPNQIGLIASAAKREHMYSVLRERGVSREAIGRIRSPVGLELGAETPAEIAVSIVAELVRGAHPTLLAGPGDAERTPLSEDDAVARTP